jgi:peptide/nickel transport system ATP-binding protein
VLFVTHDISLLRQSADRLAVMYAGQIAELGRTEQVFDHPAHPYSRGLLNAFPSIRGPVLRLTGITGSPPDLAHPPSGCRFHPRCASVMADCASTAPELLDVDGAEVRCLLYREVPAT